MYLFVIISVGRVVVLDPFASGKGGDMTKMYPFVVEVGRRAPAWAPFVEISRGGMADIVSHYKWYYQIELQYNKTVHVSTKYKTLSENYNILSLLLTQHD